MMIRTLTVVLSLLLTATLCEAKTLTRSLAWSALPPDLVGQNVKIEVAKGRRQSGRVEKVDASGITLAHRKGGRLIASADVSSIQWTTRKAPRWSIVGAAAGAAPGIFFTSLAVILNRNEGGVNGPKIIAGSVGILAGGAALGALAGYRADVDRHVIIITGP